MIQEVEEFPAIDLTSGSIVANTAYVGPLCIDLQTRNAIRKMYERGLTHHAWRRGNAASYTNRNLVQLLIGELDCFCRRTPTHGRLRFKRAKFFNQRSNRIFALGIETPAALELVRVS